MSASLNTLPCSHVSSVAQLSHKYRLHLGYVLCGAVIASTYCTYIHTYTLLCACMYVCVHCAEVFYACMYVQMPLYSVSIYYHASAVCTCVLDQYQFVLLSFMQLSWEYMHAHANVPTCLCIFIDAHPSYSRRYYFVIRNTMSKQYAITFFASMVMMMVVLTVAGWRVLCLVFRKLPQL